MARILSIDEGTTGVRGEVVDEHGELLGAGEEGRAQHRRLGDRRSCGARGEGVPVRRRRRPDGARVRGLGAGVWSSTDELADAFEVDRRFEPAMDAGTRQRLRTGWREAVDRSKGRAHVVGTQ